MDVALPTKVKDVLGQTFGRLKVVEFAGTNKRGAARWKCECECSNCKIIQSGSLLNGGTKSCGCLQREWRYHRTLPLGQASFNNLLASYRKEARRRHWGFDLSNEDFARLTKENCYFCGQPPSQIWGRKKYNGVYVYNGIDRVDSQRGYVKGNCVAACGKCNYMKNDLSINGFIAHINRIAACQIEKMRINVK